MEVEMAIKAEAKAEASEESRLVAEEHTKRELDVRIKAEAQAKAVELARIKAEEDAMKAKNAEAEARKALEDARNMALADCEQTKIKDEGKLKIVKMHEGSRCQGNQRSNDQGRGGQGKC